MFFELVSKSEQNDHFLKSMLSFTYCWIQSECSYIFFFAVNTTWNQTEELSTWDENQGSACSALCLPSCIHRRLHYTYRAMKFGMDTRWWANHAKQCFSFVYNRSHNQIIALPVENQNGKRFVSNTIWLVRLNVSMRNSFPVPLLLEHWYKTVLKTIVTTKS